MVYTTYNISFNFHFPCTLYMVELAFVNFPTYIRCSDTNDVMENFDFIRKRILRMCKPDELFLAQRIKLDEYTAMTNMS